MALDGGPMFLPITRVFFVREKEELNHVAMLARITVVTEQITSFDLRQTRHRLSWQCELHYYSFCGNIT